MNRGKLSVILILFFLAAMGALWAFRFFGPRPKPNILLITLDTVRWDRISCYGQAKNTTPTIDKLAAEGVRYQRAITPASWTLPAHASMFTGVLPSRHGAHYVTNDANAGAGLFQANKMDAELPTLAEELKKAGYGTGAVISGPLLHSRFGTNKGFDYYDDKNLFSAKKSEFHRRAHETTDLAVQWLRRHLVEFSEKPFFLFLNYYDAHSPYTPPEPWGDPTIPLELCSSNSGRYDDVLKANRDLTGEEHRLLLLQYDGEIGFVDSQIKRLFSEMKRLGVYDSTLIVVTSDHGESFGEHRLLGHGRALYEELIRVPLIIKYPLKDKKIGVVKERVSLLSLMPTLLEYIGHPVPKTVASGTLHDKEQVLIAEIFRDVGWIVAYGARFDRDLKAIYDGDYKLIWSSTGQHELYNIEADPDESRDLREDLPKMASRLQSQALSIAHESKRPSTTASPEIDDEMKESLKALGYMR